MIIREIVDLDAAVRAATHDHVVLAAAAEITEAHDLPIAADSAQGGGIGDVVIIDVVDLECTGAVAQQHVGRVTAVEAAERDKRPIRSHLT